VSTDPSGAAAQTGQEATAGAAAGQPSEEELRAAYEAEMSRVTSTDMILQAVVSLLNIGGHRLGLSPGPDRPVGEGRDLEQVRDAIDGVRALLGILERRETESLRPLRDALSQLQMAYAREAGAGASSPADRPDQADRTEAQPAPAAKPAPPAPQDKPADGPGPAQSSGRLWVPGR
jgi:hypothetical protein